MRANKRHLIVTMTAVAALAAACSSPATMPPVSPPSSQSTRIAAASSAVSTPRPTSALLPLPAGMRFRWLREPREISGLTEPPIAAMLELTATRLQFVSSLPKDGSITRTLGSRIGLDATGSVNVNLVADGNGCHAGDGGTYAVALNSSGLGLSVTPESDPCAVRRTALAGDWIRSSCPTNPNQACLGDLDPGRHVSVNYLPFGKWADWQFDYGRFEYTVPDGWANLEDNPDGFVLAPRSGPDATGIFLFTDPRAQSQAKGCGGALDPAVGPSARDLTAWLRSLTGLVVRNVKPVEIGGLRGTQLDLSVAPGRHIACDWGEQSGVPLFSNASHDDFDWGIADTGRMRLFVLRLEPDRALVIDIEAQDKATWDALVPQAMPIVESFAFRR